MREQLGELLQTRMSFTAKVGRFGTKRNYHGFPEPTICFCDVKDSEGNMMTDISGSPLERLLIKLTYPWMIKSNLMPE